MKRRFLIGLLAVVIVSSPAFAQDADKSGKSEAPIVVRVVPMKHAFSGQIASVVGTVSRGVRFAWDEASNSLVLSGPEDDIAAALEVVQQLDVPRRDLATAVEGPLSLRLTVFYVEGTYDAGGAGSDSKLPEALGRVSKVLTENGMHHLRLMTSQIINIKSDEKYIAIGTLDDPSGYMRVLTRGRMKFAAPGRLAEVECESEITRVGSQSTKDVFSFQTTLVTRLGEYVVIGASPMQADGQKALALILRVDSEDGLKD